MLGQWTPKDKLSKDISSNSLIPNFMSKESEVLENEIPTTSDTKCSGSAAGATLIADVDIGFSGISSIGKAIETFLEVCPDADKVQAEYFVQKCKGRAEAAIELYFRQQQEAGEAKKVISREEQIRQDKIREKLWLAVGTAEGQENYLAFAKVKGRPNIPLGRVLGYCGKDIGFEIGYLHATEDRYEEIIYVKAKDIERGGIQKKYASSS